MSENITFRTQLLGGVSEFCDGTDLPILNNALRLVELIVLLARYQEEGIKLSPKVYLTNDIEKIVSMLPGSERLKIGSTTSDVNGIKESVKRCAPLATGGWLIYIQNNTDSLEYGLFIGSINPISVLVDDVVMSANDELKVVKAFQVADDCVEVRANNGTRHYIFFNHRKDDTPPPLQFLDELVETIMEETSAKIKEPTTSFLKRLLFESLRQSHGCIVAVTNMKTSPKFLSNDGVILENPINFPELVSKLKKELIPQSCIESKAFLVNGMLNSDGIILFDTRGRLLGYNCFIKNSKKDDVIGGARKRAFATLKGKIGKGLKAVFIQSQDGWSDFYEDSND